MLTSQEEKKRHRRKVARRGLEGAAIALLIMGGVEAALQVLADGHPDPMVRVWAVAGAALAGAVLAGLRGPTKVLLLCVVLAAASAQAADRDRQYNVTISTAACPTGTPGQLYDLKTPGIALAGVRAWSVTICPTSGQTFTGVGLLRACVFRATPGPNKWALSPRFYWDMADDGTGSPITSSSSNPCVTFEDVQVGVNAGDLVYVYPSTDFGVSGGTAISVYLSAVF